MGKYVGNSRSGYEHRRVAEAALGRPLPKGAVVHHVNHDPRDNRPENLVIFQNQAEHKAAHKRERALKACGHADWIPCDHCKEYMPPDAEDAYISQRAGRPYPRAIHKRCHPKYRDL